MDYTVIFDDHTNDESQALAELNFLSKRIIEESEQIIKLIPVLDRKGKPVCIKSLRFLKHTSPIFANTFYSGCYNVKYKIDVIALLSLKNETIERDPIFHYYQKKWDNYISEGIEKEYLNPDIKSKIQIIWKSDAIKISDSSCLPKPFHSRDISSDLKGFIQKVKTDLLKQLKRIRRSIHYYITLDIRFLIRTIIRSLSITTFDGKDADSNFSLTNSVKVNHVNHLKNQILWTRNRRNYSWYNTPSMN